MGIGFVVVDVVVVEVVVVVVVVVHFIAVVAFVHPHRCGEMKTTRIPEPSVLNL